MNVTDKVIEILKKMSGMDVVSAEDNLQSDLGLDSLLMVTLLVEIEDGFEIELHESDMNPFDLTTVEDVVALVSKYDTDKNEEAC